MRIYGKTRMDQWREDVIAGKAVALDHALKVYVPETKALDPEKRTVRFRITTGKPDRMRDQIDPSGWDLKSYKKNPVVLWAHQYGGAGLFGGGGSGLPIAKAISIKADEDGLISDAQFATKEQYEFADTVYQLILGGFLNAVSVGFKPIKHVYNEKRGGIDFLEQELLEYSVVPIPANADALLEAAAKGIDVAPVQEYLEALLDHMEPDLGTWLPKAQVETVLAHLPAHVSHSIWPGMVTSVSGMVTVTAASTAKECLDGTDGCPGDHPKGSCPNKPKRAPVLILDLAALEEVDVEKPYPNEHACRLADPGKFEKIRSGTRKHEGKVYRVLYGKPKGSDAWEEQAFRYPKGSWSAEEAGAHCKDSGGSFEAASGKDGADAETVAAARRLLEAGDSAGALALLRDGQPEAQAAAPESPRVILELEEEWTLEIAPAEDGGGLEIESEAIARAITDWQTRSVETMERTVAALITSAINKARGRAD